MEKPQKMPKVAKVSKTCKLIKEITFSNVTLFIFSLCKNYKCNFLKIFFIMILLSFSYS